MPYLENVEELADWIVKGFELLEEDSTFYSHAGMRDELADRIRQAVANENLLKRANWTIEFDKPEDSWVVRATE